MSIPLYNEMMQNQNSKNLINRENLINEIQKLKSMYNNPNEKIQELLNSGKVTQEQYNEAFRKAQVLKRMFNL